jgi:hypothetical protein
MQALWDLTLFQLVKDDYQQGPIGYIFGIEQWKINGFLFKQNSNICFLY